MYLIFSFSCHSVFVLFSPYTSHTHLIPTLFPSLPNHAAHLPLPPFPGNGQCLCGECQCDPGYIMGPGSTLCDCPLNETSCLEPITSVSWTFTTMHGGVAGESFNMEGWKGIRVMYVSNVYVLSRSAVALSV